ncbi:MAG TPA: cupin domain-containing protein [Symbiobacteriaceae bacterium]|nr:cupin domain-containing protein [Symbiobacteriaceae bacterium]
MAFSKPEFEFFDPEQEIGWKPVPGYPDGIYERVLSMDEESGDHTRLLYFKPGVETSDRLLHEFWEEVYIVKGGLIDKTLGKTFTEGMYACRPPGMLHGPYSVPVGCVTFEIRYFKK